LNADDATGMLYVSHGKMVHVVDMKTGKNVATITDVNGVHGIAIAMEFNKGFISNGPDSNVTVFNLKDYSIIEKVPVTGKNPDAIIFEPFSKTIITWNGRSSNATGIDPKTDKVIQTIQLSGKPEAAVSDGKGKVFVNIEDKSEGCMINVKTWKVEQTWPISPGEEPSGLALDNVGHIHMYTLKITFLTMDRLHKLCFNYSITPHHLPKRAATCNCSHLTEFVRGYL
jgi:DNA-binding beta-propeller fold protein YncE